MAVATELLYRNYDSSDATFSTAYSNELFPTIENVGWAAQAGHIFKEWNTSRDGTGASFDPGDSFPSPASYTTFYAIWEECDISISYKGSSIATMSASGTKTLETEGKYCEDDITITYTKPAAPVPTLQTKSATYTPSTSQQTASITADAGYDGLDEVNVTVNAMPSGTAGTPTATKGIVSSNSVSVTPSVTNTTGYITGGTINGTPVTVSASELVSGTKNITASGTTDVTNYASASVAAGSATTPATTITANPSISVSSGGLITASVSGSQSVTPTVSVGYVSSGTAGTITVSGSATQQLSVYAGAHHQPPTYTVTISLTNPTSPSYFTSFTIFEYTGNVKGDQIGSIDSPTGSTELSLATDIGAIRVELEGGYVDVSGYPVFTGDIDLIDSNWSGSNVYFIFSIGSSGTIEMPYIDWDD